MLSDGIMWARHELSHHEPRVLHKDFECQFCAKSFTNRYPAYLRHVAGHLREISLSVLPIGGHESEEENDEDADEKSENTNSAKEDGTDEGNNEDTNMREKGTRGDGYFVMYIWKCVSH